MFLKVSITSLIMVPNVSEDLWSQLTIRNVLRISASPHCFTIQDGRLAPAYLQPINFGKDAVQRNDSVFFKTKHCFFVNFSDFCYLEIFSFFAISQLRWKRYSQELKAFDTHSKAKFLPHSIFLKK